MVVRHALESPGIVKIGSASPPHVFRDLEILHHVIKFVHALPECHSVHIHRGNDAAKVSNGIGPKDGGCRHQHNRNHVFAKVCRRNVSQADRRQHVDGPVERNEVLFDRGKLAFAISKLVVVMRELIRSELVKPSVPASDGAPHVVSRVPGGIGPPSC